MPVYNITKDENGEFVAIQESKNSEDLSTISTDAEHFYEHCLKWKFNQTFQTESWFETIVNCSQTIKTLIDNSTNTRNDANDIDLKKKYDNAKDDQIKKYKLVVKDDDVYFTFRSIDLITNPDHIMVFLISCVHPTHRDELYFWILNCPYLSPHFNMYARKNHVNIDKIIKKFGEKK